MKNCKECWKKVKNRNISWKCRKCLTPERRYCYCWKRIKTNNMSWKCRNHSKMITHWLSSTTFYVTFTSLRNRCNNEKNQNYKYYWWRWIKCERKSFSEYKDDMYESWLEFQKENDWYVPTIERINWNWNYCKDNCKWIKKNDQPKNRKWNRYITRNWITDTIAWRWRRLWIHKWTLSRRINDWYSIEMAFWEVEVQKTRGLTVDWKYFSIHDIMKMLWVWRTTAYHYINNKPKETQDTIYSILCKDA
jgi:hypothetical protein